MRCLIIGDNQFYDWKIAKELLIRGSTVALVDPNPPPSEIEEDTHHISGDADSLLELEDAIAEFKADTVIHLSAREKSHASSIKALFENKVEHLIIGSSSNVYKANALVYKTELGDIDNTPIAEGSLLREKALGKESSHDRLGIEESVAKGATLSTILRLPPVYGVGDSLYRLLPLMSRMIDKRPFIVVAESQSDWRWSHAYSDDVAHAFALAALKPGESNRVYNVGENKAPTIMERIIHLATIFGWEGDLVSLPDSELPPHILPVGNFDQNLELDSSKIRAELEYKEVTDYYDGLYESIEWYKENLPPVYKDSNFNYESEDALKELVDERAQS